jgi:pimeloyl-ACP methyl ester carboxylesterase
VRLSRTWAVTGLAAAATTLAIVLFAGLAARGAFGSAVGAAREAYDRPGRPVTLPDHRRLNFRCMGQGSPTVILEAGFGAGSNAWESVQPKIARVTRVCAYDRAGYGFSDPGPLPRDGEAIARDLDFGLKAADIAGPYVVVGHSAGGLYARLFAARRRKDVVGLVFVDSSVEHQTQRMVALFGPGAGGIEGIVRRPKRCLEATLAPQAPENAAVLLDCAPATADAQAQLIGRRPDTWRTQISELETLFTTTSDEVDRTGDILRGIPAIVLTASAADGAPTAGLDPGAVAWQNFHRHLAAGFERGDQRLVKSSHLMMKDRPDMVAAATIELVQAARKR